MGRHPQSPTFAGLFRSLTLALVVLLSCSASASPDWSKVRISVTPGVGTKDFQLDHPLPKEWPKALGAPDQIFAFHATGESVRRLCWGEMKAGQLHQGVALVVVGKGEESSVVDLEFRRIRAGVDKENLFLGLPEENISKRSTLVQKDGKKSFLLPGLAIETSDGKMVSLRVHSPSATRWRFQRWRVRPGQAAGPIRLGEKVDPSLFQSIGEPHERSREVLLWQADDSSQTLKVSLDNRTEEVTRVRGVGLPWRTPNGVTLGDSSKLYKEKHPEARSGVGRGIDESLMKLPGLRATFTKDRLTSFDVFLVSSD